MSVVYTPSSLAIGRLRKSSENAIKAPITMHALTACSLGPMFRSRCYAVAWCGAFEMSLYIHPSLEIYCRCNIPIGKRRSRIPEEWSFQQSLPLPLVKSATSRFCIEHAGRDNSTLCQIMTYQLPKGSRPSFKL